MAFLLITDSIENTIEMLRSDQKLCETVYQQTGNEVHKAKAQDYGDKLNTALRYQKFFNRKSDYEKIKHLKEKKPNSYIAKCVAIAKGLKGIYFDKKRQLFVVQIRKAGKTIYLGSFDTPDDALEILALNI